MEVCLLLITQMRSLLVVVGVVRLFDMLIWDWLLYGLIFCLFLECFEVNG